MPTVEAKSKVRARHLRAIEKFQEWLVENPDAPLKKQIKQFDLLVDSAALQERLK